MGRFMFMIIGLKSLPPMIIATAIAGYYIIMQ